MKKQRSKVVTIGRPALLATLAGIMALLPLLYRLQSLAPHLSPTEHATFQSASLREILADPLDAPLKLLQWLGTFAPIRYQLLFVRLPSVLLALGGVALFMYILHRWYGRRSMVFGFVLLLSSAWFLHIGRFAGSEIEYLTGILALLASHIAVQDHEDSRIVGFLWMATNVVLLFIPGMLWFVILNAIWQGYTIAAVWKNLKPLWTKLTWLLLPIIGLVAIAISIARRTSLLLTWIGVPPSMLSKWRTIPTNLLHTLEAIIIHGPHRPELWLGQLPLLDIFIFAMFLAGVAFYAQHWQALRTRMLLSIFLLGIVLASFGIVGLSVLLPILYIVAIAGVAYILHFWLMIFPRNPVARLTGISLVSVVVALSCTYGLVQYFVAWPHNTETVAIYRHPGH